MFNKISANKSIMPTKTLKLVYVQSLTANNAFGQIKPKLDLNVTKLFVTASEMFEMLTAIFSNALCKQKACIKFKFLY